MFFVSTIKLKHILGQGTRRTLC